MNDKLPSGIIRIEHDKDRPYFIMSRALAEDARLSYAARGLMCYLLAKPDNWELRMGDLIKSSPGGLRHVRAVLKELEEFGYVRRMRETMSNGRFIWSTVVYESPLVHFASMENPSVVNVPIYQGTNGVNTQGLINKTAAAANLTRTREARTVDSEEIYAAAAVRKPA